MIPRGFADGFLVISDHADFLYKCDDFYYPNDEGGLLWNDPEIAIDWPLENEIILNDKDRNNPTLEKIEWNFKGE
jgi:dTDP-4-dehydrorhamnose 3,5-epimerase